MGRKNVILVFVFLTCVFPDAGAQPRLVLLKGDRQVSAFREGDYIRFKRSDRDHFTAGLIGGLARDYLRIGEDTTWLYLLEKIDLSGHFSTRFKASQMGATLMVAGGVLFLGDLINETLVNDNSYSADSGVITASAVLVVTGVVLQLIPTNYYSLGRRRRVLVLDY